MPLTRPLFVVTGYPSASLPPAGGTADQNQEQEDTRGASVAGLPLTQAAPLGETFSQ